MTGVVITTVHLLDRIGGPNELPKDRRHCFAMLNWQFNRNWREAEEAGDVERLGYLARTKETWDGL